MKARQRTKIIACIIVNAVKKNKPASISLESFLIELRELMPLHASRDSASSRTEWRDRALRLERQLEESREAREAAHRNSLNEHIQKNDRTRSSTAPNQPKFNISVSSAPPQPPLNDWAKVIELLTQALYPTSIVEDLEVMADLQENPHISLENNTQLLKRQLEQAFETIFKMTTIVVDYNLSRTQRVQTAQDIAILLPALICDALPHLMAINDEASPSCIAQQLMEQLMQPLLGCFRQGSHARCQVPSYDRDTSNPDIRIVLLNIIQGTFDAMLFTSSTTHIYLTVLVGSAIMEALNHHQDRAIDTGMELETDQTTNEDLVALTEYATARDSYWYILAALNICVDQQAPATSLAFAPALNDVLAKYSDDLTSITIRFGGIRIGDTCSSAQHKGWTAVEQGMILAVYEKAWLSGWLG